MAISARKDAEQKSLMGDGQETGPDITSQENANSTGPSVPKHSPQGLSTKEALQRLYSDINILIEDHLIIKQKRRQYAWLLDSVQCSSQYTTLCWTSAMALFVTAVIMFIAYLSSSHPRLSSLPLEAVVICILTTVNFCLIAWDNKLRHNEVPLAVQALLLRVKEAVERSCWQPENYPHLCSPLSPCITLQWTYRDGVLVNLPWALLVAGDIVVLRPGQLAPAPCTPLHAHKELPDLQHGDVFSPAPTKQREMFSIPTARSPLQNEEYVIQQTPYLSNLRLALEQALERPITYYNSQRHNLMLKYVEHLALPITLSIVLLANLSRLAYLQYWVSSGPWVEMILLQPIAVILPLLPVVFPSAWLVLTCLGMARLLVILDLSPHQHSKPLDPFEDAEAEPRHDPINLPLHLICKHLMDVLRGTEPILCRSASILHVLGSVTALCCVDKKGILSWPNPTAEKVFFLRNSSPTSQSSSLVSEDAALYSDPGAVPHSVELNAGEESVKRPGVTNETTTVAEVLDLTHDHSSPFRLQFDDHTWKQHLSSLKPLGLAILLNTCNMATQEHYTAFCAHVTCEALHNEDLVPVTNRRFPKGSSHIQGSQTKGLRRALSGAAKDEEVVAT